MSDEMKLDAGKPPMSLVPRDAKVLLARVLEFGAKKYAPWKWAEGMEWSRLLSAAYRHLDDWAEGVDLDPDSKLSHLGHCLACITFLAVYEARELGTDDRHKWIQESFPNPSTCEERFQAERWRRLVEAVRSIDYEVPRDDAAAFNHVPEVAFEDNLDAALRCPGGFKLNYEFLRDYGPVTQDEFERAVAEVKNG